MLLPHDILKSPSTKKNKKKTPKPLIKKRKFLKIIHWIFSIVEDLQQEIQKKTKKLFAIVMAICFRGMVL